MLVWFIYNRSYLHTEQVLLLIILSTDQQFHHEKHMVTVLRKTCASTQKMKLINSTFQYFSILIFHCLKEPLLIAHRVFEMCMEGHLSQEHKGIHEM